MSKKKIELLLHRVYTCSKEGCTYVISLEEVGGLRKIPLIVGTGEAQAILMAQSGITPPRPLMHQVLASVFQVLDVHYLNALIYKEEKGVYYSYIYLRFEDKLLRVESRPSDALALSLVADVPIYVYEDLLEEADQFIPEEISNEIVKERETSLLEAELKRAIEVEDYERAAVIRDKLKELNEK
ncbi:MAG: bifunctional nuclease family protein [Bacteroides sp.]|nr:bifunctional nuclease family protein [Bacteroides sp.]